jgi:hypothetical protein
MGKVSMDNVKSFSELLDFPLHSHRFSNNTCSSNTEMWYLKARNVRKICKELSRSGRSSVERKGVFPARPPSSTKVKSRFGFEVILG